MNAMPMPSRGESVTVRWVMGAVALLVGLFLMIYYVQLLQDSVARGAQWRYSQKTAQDATGVAAPARIRLVSAAR